jgi:hypothetical protein
VAISRKTLCTFVGGIGGLAPIVCQALALCVPDLEKGIPAINAKYGSLVTTVSQAFLVFMILLTLFLVAAAVTYSEIGHDVSEPTHLRKAFLIGVSVPSLIVTLGNGVSNGSRRTEMATVSTAFARLSTPIPLIRLAAATSDRLGNPEPRVDLKVRYDCPDCPSRLINILRIGHSSSPTGQAADEQVIVLSSALAGGEGSAEIMLRARTEFLCVTIPNYELSSSRNPLIWNTFEARSQVSDGDQLLLSMKLRPGVWNPVRLFFGLERFYVIEDSKLTAGRRGNA